jgi:hypothetical protein
MDTARLRGQQPSLYEQSFMRRQSGLHLRSRKVCLRPVTTYGVASFHFVTENIMKTKMLIPAVLASALSLPALSTMAATNTTLLGESAPAAAADQTIRIDPDTKYVNVEGGQIVKFEAGSKSFTWDFNGPIGTFELGQVAPPSFLDHHVMVYQAPNPLYSGN